MRPSKRREGNVRAIDWDHNGWGRGCGSGLVGCASCGAGNEGKLMYGMTCQQTGCRDKGIRFNLAPTFQLGPPTVWECDGCGYPCPVTRKVCAEMVVDFNPWVIGSSIPRQCKRKATHGDYCWQHKDTTYISDEWETEATHKLTHDGTNPNCTHCNT